ncbi:hypothetical protein [Dictyobacter vulcani]|nr:hypothetical protein [Dictyobacter vulcani]
MKRFMQNNGNNTGFSDRDPLLLPGARGTIIGWAQNASNNANGITVNGQSTNGSQETMVQAPLDMQFSGPITLPSSVINSQIVHVQQNSPGSIQEPIPETYMMTSGNMTIEYMLPTTAPIQDSQFTLTSSTSPTKNIPMNLGVTSDINHIQSYLYNWQKQSWDAISFSQFSCTVKNAQAYIGPDGRILLHLNNHDTSAVFDKPALQLQGTIAH